MLRPFARGFIDLKLRQTKAKLTLANIPHFCLTFFIEMTKMTLVRQTLQITHSGVILALRYCCRWRDQDVTCWLTLERRNTHCIGLLNCCCCCVRVNRTPKIRIRKRKTENRKENGKQERKQKIKISKVKTGESRKGPTGRQQKQNQQRSKENRPQKTENSKRKTDKWNIEP